MLFIPVIPFCSSFVIILILREYAAAGNAVSDHTSIVLPEVSGMHAARSIQSLNGDAIDCVPLDKQPALHHPLLKDHRIQTRASSKPKYGDEEILGNSAVASRKERIRQESQSAGQCPNGTVPIYRTPFHNMRITNLLQHYGKRTLKLNNSGNAATSYDEDDPAVHEYAAAFTSNQPVYGAKATISIWDPFVQTQSDEFSISQIWITGGDDADLNTVEAGWMVYPRLNNDSQPRFFTYWTNDGYATAGCYNLECPGFVQISKNLAPGARMAPWSSLDGDQREMELFVWKDHKTANWWLSSGGMEIGYWPAELFPHLKGHGSIVIWGGEVVNDGRGGRHTSTQMGSGRFPGEGYRKASYFRRLQVVGSGSGGGVSVASPAKNLSVVVTANNCYDIKVNEGASAGDWGTFFYYGGPGKNPKCP